MVRIITVILSIFLLYPDNHSFAEEEKEEKNDSLVAFLPSTVPFKDLFFVVGESADQSPKNMIRMNMTIDLVTNADFIIVEKNTEQIKSAMEDYFKNSSSRDISGIEGLDKIKKDVTFIINNLISPKVIKNLYLTDIVVQ